MPTTNKRGKPIESELPSPVQRSDAHAQATFAKTYDAAMEEYRDQARANATAYASLKHTYDKVGDHWERPARPTTAPRKAASTTRSRPAAWTPTPRRRTCSASPAGSR